jgi:hypothetical protein
MAVPFNPRDAVSLLVHVIFRILDDPEAFVVEQQPWVHLNDLYRRS